jgi:multidrug efflux system outer membrane protein
MNRGARLGMLATVALLGACMSLAPEYQRPAAPVDADFAFAEPADTDAARQAAREIHWHDYFRDERLRRLIEIALANNRDLRVAVHSIERARAQYRVVRSEQFPTIGIGATRAREPVPSGGIGNAYVAGFSLASYELDFFGRVRNLSEAALARYLATEQARYTVQIGLVAAVANTWLDLLADEELLAVTREALRTREESFELTKLRYESGVASELDFRQAESLLEAARVTLEALRRRHATDQNALVSLLGQPLPADLPTGSPRLAEQMLAELPAGLPSEVLTRRPDIRQAELELQAANANIGVARAGFFPSISLTASVGTASAELSGLFAGGSGAWTFTAQLFQSLFSGGRDEAQVELARADREIALAQYERAIQTAFREVSDALAGRATLGRQLLSQQRQMRAEQRRFELADLRYRSGAASYLDVLDAQRSLFATQQAVVEARAALIQNQVALYRALGGGWSSEERDFVTDGRPVQGTTRIAVASNSGGAAPVQELSVPRARTAAGKRRAPVR